MKPLHSLTCSLLLLSGTLDAADDGAKEATRSDVEDAVVDFSATTPSLLEDVLTVLSEQFDNPPSLILKDGSRAVQVPPMHVANVRFGDVIQALEELCGVRIKILNPQPAPGESSLLVVDRIQRMIDESAFGGPEKTRPAAGPEARATLRQRNQPQPQNVLPPAAGDPLATPHADAGEQQASPGATPGFPGRPAGTSESVPVLSDVPHVGGVFGTEAGGSHTDAAMMWSADGRTPHSAVTRTYAIGSLTDDEKHGHASEEVIEAIRLVWNTSRPEAIPESGKDGPRISLHEPSGLLIVKAPADLQSLAAETISNLTTARQQRLEQHAIENRTAALQEEFRRERDHLEQLHQITLERLKANHAAEVDQLEATVAQLQAQLRLLEARNRKGGD